jgi:hypothetical protein
MLVLGGSCVALALRERSGWGVWVVSIWRRSVKETAWLGGAPR